jgi:hypothetical protein
VHFSALGERRIQTLCKIYKVKKAVFKVIVLQWDIFSMGIGE